MSKKFEVTVIKKEAVEVFGRHKSVTYATAAVDCPKLWEDFCQEYFACGKGGTDGCSTCPDMNNCSFDSDSYGLSIMTSPSGFEYWVALPVASYKPSDLPKITIPAGEYACCECHGFEDIGPAFQFLYMNQASWLTEDMPYQLNMGAPCFEWYPKDFMTEKRFYICAPLTAKKW